MQTPKLPKDDQQPSISSVLETISLSRVTENRRGEHKKKKDFAFLEI